MYQVLPGSIVIRRLGGPPVVDEEARIQRSRNDAIGSRGSLEVEKSEQIGVGALVSEAQGALGYVERRLDESQNASKVVRSVIDVSLGCVGGHNQQGDAEAVLVVSLRVVEHVREHM